MTGIVAALAILFAAAYGWPVAALVGGATALFWAWRRPGRAEWVAAGFVLVAATAGAARHEPPRTVPAIAWLGDAESAEGVVVTAPSTNGRYQQATVAVDRIATDAGPHPAAGLVCVAAEMYPTVALGDRLWFAGAFERTDDQPVAVRSWLDGRGCGGSVFASRLAIDEPGSGPLRSMALLRGQMSRALQHAAPGDAGVLMSGFVTGDDNALTDARHEAFVRTSTVHLTAVSGSNLALLVVILVGAGGLLGVGRALGWQVGVVAAVWAYAVLVGLEPPALRAAVVASAAVLAFRVGRKPDFVTLILLAGAIEVLARPQDIWSLSFRLSMAASLALALVMTGMRPEGRLGWLVVALVATGVAEIATLPVLLPVVGTVALAGLPTNVLIAAPAELAFVGSAVAAVAALVWYPLGEALAVPARLATSLALGVVDRFGATGWASQPLGRPGDVPALVLSVGVAAAIVLASADGRQLVRRARRDLGGGDAKAHPRLGWIGLVGGALLGVLLTVLL